MHFICTICSDLLNQVDNIYVTQCGHIFHHFCVGQWLERSKTCPQCRRKVTEKSLIRVFATASNEAVGVDVTTLQSRLDDTSLQIRHLQTAAQEREDAIQSATADLMTLRELLKIHEKKLVTRESAISALKEQMKYLQEQNKETVRLKAENEDLNKNLQTLNGLQKVLNATSEEVEQMLQGYTDLKTIATFATALKRALCESEAKKNESRDRLHAAKHQIGIEKNNVAELTAKIVQLEEKLENIEQKYEALKKRKACDLDMSTEHASPKQKRLSDSIELNTAVLDSSTSSMNSMVRRIENADSPYLSLKQSSLALSTLQRGPISVPTGNMKPSEFAIVNAARNYPQRCRVSSTIFHKKETLKPVSIQTSDKPVNIDLDITYDGMGGHSKPDTFPQPIKRLYNSCVPRLTAKHKLKRPAPNGSQDIGKMMKNMTDEKL